MLEHYLLLLTDPKPLLVGPFREKNERRAWKKTFIENLEDDALYLTDSADAILYENAIVIHPSEAVDDVEEWLKGEQIDFDRTTLEPGSKVLIVEGVGRGSSVIVGPLGQDETVWTEGMQIQVEGIRWPYDAFYYPVSDPVEFIKAHQADIYCYRNMPHPRNCPKCYPDALPSAQGSIPVVLKVSGRLEEQLWECIGPFPDDESAQKVCDQINDDPRHAGPAFLTHAFVQHLFAPPEHGRDFIGRAWREKSVANQHVDEIPDWLMQLEKEIAPMVQSMFPPGTGWPPKHPRENWPQIVVMYDGPSIEEGSYMLVGPFPSLSTTHEWLAEYGRGAEKLQSQTVELWPQEVYASFFGPNNGGESAVES